MADMNVAVILSLVDQLSGQMARPRSALTDFGAAAAGIGVQAAATATAAVAGSIAFGTTQAITFEEQLAEINKSLGETPQGLAQLGAEIIEVSQDFGIAREAASQIYEALAPGRDRTDLTEYARLALEMGVAFSMASSQVGGLIGGLQTAYGTDASGVEHIGDVANVLANNLQTNGSYILGFSRDIGAVGSMLGLTEEAIASLGATFANMQLPQNVAKTFTENLVTRLSTIEDQSPDFMAALENLGLSAETFSEAIETDANAALDNLLERLSQAENATGISRGLVGQEFATDLARLSTALDFYREANELAANGDLVAGSMTSEVEARMQTAGTTVSRIREELSGLTLEAGQALLPLVSDGLDSLLSFLQSIETGENPLVRVAAAIASMSSEIGDLGSGAAEAGMAVLERLGSLASGSWTGASQNAGELALALGKLGTGLERVHAVFANDDSDQVLNGYERLGNFIGSATVSHFARLANGLAEIVEAIATILETAIEIGDRLEQFGTRFREIMTTSAGGLEGVINWMSNGSGGDDPISQLDPAPIVAAADAADRLGAAFSSAQQGDDYSGLASALAAHAESGAVGLDTSSALSSVTALADRSQDLAPIVRAALQEAQSVLASEDWSGHGARLMGTLADGVRSGTGPLASAISSAIQSGVSQGVSSGLSSALSERRQSALQDGTEL